MKLSVIQNIVVPKPAFQFPTDDGAMISATWRDDAEKLVRVAGRWLSVRTGAVSGEDRILNEMTDLKVVSK